MPQWCWINNLNSIQLRLRSPSNGLRPWLRSPGICGDQRKISWGGTCSAFKEHVLAWRSDQIRAGQIPWKWSWWHNKDPSRKVLPSWWGFLPGPWWPRQELRLQQLARTQWKQYHGLREAPVQNVLNFPGEREGRSFQLPWTPVTFSG